MIEPLELSSQKRELDQLVSELRHGLELAELLPNVDDRLAQLKKLLEADNERREGRSDHPALIAVLQDIKDRTFELTSVEAAISRIEERLGQGVSEPVDLTLQQTLDVVEQLRQISRTVPNDERMAMVATNICEGLESFVTTMLPGSPSDGGQSADSPSGADLELALGIIETVTTCPGTARQSMYKSLRRQFIDVACRAAWSRVDRLLDIRLDRATRKGYLHEALTIWTLTPDLAENAGSPRLSQLPSEIQRSIQRVLLREVVGSVPDGDLNKLLDAALLTKEFTDEYLSMLPAISIPDAQEAIGLHAIETVVRRLEAGISRVRTWEDLETCLGIITVLRTLENIDEDRLQRLSRPVAIARRRLRLHGIARSVRRAVRPAAVISVGLLAVAGAYIGVALLVEHLYDYVLPLTP